MLFTCDLKSFRCSILYKSVIAVAADNIVHCGHALWPCDLTVQQSRGDRMVQTITAVAAVAAGNLIIIGALQGQVRGRALLKLPFQDPAHRVAPPTGRTCKKDMDKVNDWPQIYYWLILIMGFIERWDGGEQKQS